MDHTKYNFGLLTIPLYISTCVWFICTFIKSSIKNEIVFLVYIKSDTLATRYCMLVYSVSFDASEISERFNYLVT